MTPKDIAGRDFNPGDIVAFAANEVKIGNSTYKNCGLQLGVVRGVSDKDKVLVRLPSGFGGLTSTFDTWIRDSRNAVVLSQFVIPEIEDTKELWKLREELKN